MSLLASNGTKYAKFAEDWLRDAMGPEKVAERRGELEAEIERLQSVRQGIDPKQVEELENTKRLIDWWQNVAMKQYGSTMILGFAELEDAEGELGNLGSPATRRGLLDKLQAELRAYPSHVDINALIPVTPIRHVTPVDAQLEDDTEYLQGCKSDCRSTHCFPWSSSKR